MPNNSSSRKAHRQNQRRRQHNLLTLGKVKQATKHGSLSEVYSVLDKAAKKGVIHKNKANRKKSRLARKAQLPL